MAITDTNTPVGARALAALTTERPTRPGPIARLVAWRDRRRDAAALRGLSREAARDAGLMDWRSRRSSAASGGVPRAPLW